MERIPGELRDESARAALQPLADGERPAALLIAVAVCVVLALAVIVRRRHDQGPEPPRRLAPRRGPAGGSLGLLASGMYRRRYWAVLGFEALLAFQILVTSLALVVASTIAAAGACMLSIGLGGWLFWKLVRVMGRIQAAERRALHDGRSH